MSRVSKVKANEIVSFLTIKNKEELIKNKKDVSTFLYDQAKQRIPVRLMGILHDPILGKFIKKNDMLTISHNNDSVYFAITKDLPAISDHSHVTIEVSKKDFEVMSNIIEKHEIMADDLSTLKRELLGVIMELGTQKKILAEFPQASPLFKKRALNLPSNLTAIKAKLK